MEAYFEFRTYFMIGCLIISASLSFIGLGYTDDFKVKIFVFFAVSFGLLPFSSDSIISSHFKNEKYFPAETCYTYKNSYFESLKESVKDIKINNGLSEEWVDKLYAARLKEINNSLSYQYKPLYIILEYNKDKSKNLGYDFKNKEYSLNYYPVNLKKIDCGKIISLTNLKNNYQEKLND